MFQYIKSSISGNIKDTIFSQHSNIPTTNDGIELFNLITTFSTVASMQLINISFLNITNFSPMDYTCNTPLVNKKIINLFILATTSTRTLLPLERINHTLNMYGKMLQPEMWAQWVRSKVDIFEEGKITNYQDSMNSAVIKYNNIVGDDGKHEFGGAITTIQEDIVSMMATLTMKRKANDDDDCSKNFINREPLLSLITLKILLVSSINLETPRRLMALPSIFLSSISSKPTQMVYPCP